MNHAFKPIIDVLRETNKRDIKQQSECDACGKDFPAGHVVWLDSVGMWLCKRHYEEELFYGRGRR